MPLLDLIVCYLILAFALAIAWYCVVTTPEWAQEMELEAEWIALMERRKKSVPATCLGGPASTEITNHHSERESA